MKMGWLQIDGQPARLELALLDPQVARKLDVVTAHTSSRQWARGGYPGVALADGPA
jgi:hypothetical protein